MDKISFIDLFAGIGGFHLALKEFNAQCVFASEIDKEACRVYEANFNIKPYGDITKISEKDIPNHDILCAGFPCQAFSISGKQRGFEDTRGTLFFEIARIAKYKKAKILFLENVKNLIRHDCGNTFKTILRVLNDIGYDIFYKVLNASDFGLAQNRERVYIVAFRKDLKINSFNFPKPLNKKVALFDFLEDNPKDAKVIYRDDIVFTKEYKPEINIFGELELPNKPIQIGYLNKGGQGERIYSPYGHAITLSANGGGAGAKTGLYLIDNKVRKLSPRECARVQGFPEDFKIISSINQSYKQFGNSVAINVLREILKEIFALDINLSNSFKRAS